MQAGCSAGGARGRERVCKHARFPSQGGSAALCTPGHPLRCCGNHIPSLQAHRDALPKNIKDVQEHFEQKRKAEVSPRSASR